MKFASPVLIVAACWIKAHRDIRVEDNPLLLNFEAQTSGGRADIVEYCHRKTIEQVLLGYNVPDGVSRLEVNRRVATDHLSGKPGSAMVAPVQCMGGFVLSQGATNRDQGWIFPRGPRNTSRTSEYTNSSGQLPQDIGTESLQGTVKPPVAYPLPRSAPLQLLRPILVFHQSL